jgi:AraC-like DNA-binding protein
VAVIGAQSYRRLTLAMHGRVETFIIVFRPGGLSRFFRLRADALTNQHFEGRAVLGRSVDELRERLGESQTFPDRARIADHYLLSRVTTARSHRALRVSAGELLRRPGCVRMPDAADRAGLSIRQFERRFVSEIGMPPKLFSRIARFEAALQRKKRSPGLRWTDIAHALGYHDQMHMVHDFQLLSGAAPSGAAAQLDMFVESDTE